MKDFLSHPRTLTVEETARLLHSHEQTVYEMIRSGKLGYVQHGGRKLIPEETVLRYLARNFIPAEKHEPTPQEIKSFEEFNRRFEKRRKKSQKGGMS